MEGEAPPASVGPHSRVFFYAVDPNGNGTKYESLIEARRAVKEGGRGWSVEGRREAI